ncbi:MAG: rod-binding protein [Pseudomonadota bacterium]
MSDLAALRLAVDTSAAEPWRDPATHLLPSQRQSVVGPAGAGSSEAAMKAAAVKFEATFLAEMLQHTGLGTVRDGMNGGPGEKQFNGFLVREYALAIARTRPLGIGEQLVAALASRTEP